MEERYGLSWIEKAKAIQEYENYDNTSFSLKEKQLELENTLSETSI